MALSLGCGTGTGGDGAPGDAGAELAAGAAGAFSASWAASGEAGRRKKAAIRAAGMAWRIELLPMWRALTLPRRSLKIIAIILARLTCDPGRVRPQRSCQGFSIDDRR